MILYAQTPQNQTLEPILGTASSLVSLASLFLIALTIILVGLFTWQVIGVVLEEDKAEKKKKLLGVLWSAVAIAIFVSVWGIADFLRDLLGIEENQGAGTVEVPDVDFPERL